MSLTLRLLSALLLLMFAAACVPPTSPPASDGRLFADDFADTGSGWDQYTGAEGTVNYDQGHYVIQVDQPNLYLWGTPGLNLTDAVVEAEATHAAGPVNNEYGLICRFTKSGDKSSFYFFVVSSDGYYVSGKIVKNQLTYLDPVDFQEAAAIHTGAGAANHLSATCQGQTFTFAVNGQPLSQFTDSDLPYGDIGLLAGTFAEAGAGIHFDNVEVNQP